MIETIAPSLVIAAISGISFLAYKHPRAYQKLFIPICYAQLAIVVGLVIWDAAITTAFSYLLPHFKNDEVKLASETVERLSLPIEWVLLGSFSLYLFLLFLLNLPKLISDPTTEPVDHE